jgi:hypothetical protein
MSEAEQLMHELHTTVMGLTADMLARNQQFSTDYKRALSNIGLQCTERLCLSTLGLIGTALGYAGWLEICASIMVLLVYFKIKPQERVAYGDVTAIVTDAPEMPEDLELYKSGAWKSGRSKASGQWGSRKEVEAEGDISTKEEYGQSSSSRSVHGAAAAGADAYHGQCDGSIAGSAQVGGARDSSLADAAGALAAPAAADCDIEIGSNP